MTAYAPRVAIVVDHPDRDLAGLVLTALDLTRRGVVCHLVPMNLQERELWALAPDFVLFNYLRRSNERLARQLLDAGIAFGVADTEGAIWPDPEEYAGLLWKDVRLLHQARCVCMWGGALAEHLVARGLFTREQITVTGCPRFDLYADPWRELPEDAAAALRRPSRRLLINTNFSVSNPRFTTTEKNLAMHRAVLGYSEADIHRMVGAETVAIREAGLLARRLAETFPSMTIVIRPHPFEDPAPYEAAAAGLSNVHVNFAESIQAAIFGACAVIQRSCTTAIEAGLAGVPTFSPQWMPAPFLMPAAEAVSVPCETFDALAGHLAAVINGTWQAPDDVREAMAGVVRDCCCAADGQSHRRVADTVFRALTSHPRIDQRRCRRWMYGLDAARDARATRVARQLRYGLRLSPEWSFARMREVPAVGWMQGRKHFDVAGVRQLVDRARRLGPGVPDFLGDVQVRGAAGTDGWRGAFSRYGATLAPQACESA